MLTTSVERLEGNQVKLKVTVPANEVQEAIEAAYKQVAGKVRLPGFRPGKAPKQLIDNAVGREYVLQEATEHLVNTTYPKAVDAEQLRPIESPELNEIDTIVPGEDYTYEADVEVRPELALASTEGLEITMPLREATQSDIDNQVLATREQFATLEPVEDRGVEVDDFVLLSFTGTVDGEAYDGNVVDKYLYEMSRGLMPPEFDTGIVGMKAGDERHVEFEIPDTSSNPEFVGKTAGFDVTVHEVKAKKLPELDDEFATLVGGFDSVDELIADFKNRIDLQKSSSYDRIKERKVRELVADRLVGDVPDSMVQSRKATLIRDFIQMLEGRGMEIYDYLQASGITTDQLEEDMKEQAAQSLREDLALEGLFRAKGMDVSSEDIEEELNSIATAMETTPEEARKRWEDMGLMPVLTEQLMHRKATQWLLDNVTVTEETETVEDKPASGTKKAAAKKKPAKKKTEKTEEEPAEETEE